ncbi:ABC transporter permease [Halocatena salina]|uniref:ABC transporter permease n=1 Tax=Halocatena salina TaxID=2934340 RepID=A0A8T9ZYI3_9EURY|nr:ABC transporter permease subunit [Halocatena salina]UPM41731.1 ABC transporter permease [Halocatena salina]
MRWFPLARKEFRGIVRYKGTWLFTLLLVYFGYQPSYIGYRGIGPDITIAYIQNFATMLLPLGVLLLSYRSIIKERRSGSLKFPLGLPLTRTDVLLGKIAGRTAGLGASVLVACLALASYGLVRYGLFSPLRFVAVVLTTLVYVLVLVSIAVAISAVTRRAITATVGVFAGLYLPLFVFWQIMIRWLNGMITDTGAGTATATGVQAFEPGGVYFLLLRLAPGNAYTVLTNWLLGVGNAARGYVGVVRTTQASSSPQVSAFPIVETTLQDPPLYLHEAGGLLVLAVWAVVPIGLAWLRFTRGDVI